MSTAVSSAAPAVVALVTDLMFRTQIRELAASGQAVVSFVRTANELRAAVGSAVSPIVIIDLNCKGEEGLPGARVAKELGVERTVAFLSHVDESLNAAASALGIEVVARSKFVKMLPSLLGVTVPG